MVRFHGILEWSRRINVNKLRYLSYSLILFTFTPLSSLWIVFVSQAGFISNNCNNGNNNDDLLGVSPPSSSSDAQNHHHHPYDNDDGGTSTTSGNNDDHYGETGSSSSSSSSSLLAALRNPNATFEEILTLVLMERASNTFFGGAGGPPNMIMARHWALVIPWALSMLFGFIIPIVLYILSLIRSRRLQQLRDYEEEEANHHHYYRRKRRREKILPILRKYSMKLREEDRCNANDITSPSPSLSSSSEAQNQASINVTTNAAGASTWRIPHPGSVLVTSGEEKENNNNNNNNNSEDSKETTVPKYSCSHASDGDGGGGCYSNPDGYCFRGYRSVTGECSICLNQYDVGNEIVWSQFQCCHVYHLDCLIDWFSMRRRKQYLCPCCRQIYFTKSSSSSS